VKNIDFVSEKEAQKTMKFTKEMRHLKLNLVFRSAAPSNEKKRRQLT
jgi:hypothetical protein